VGEEGGGGGGGGGGGREGLIRNSCPSGFRKQRLANRTRILSISDSRRVDSVTPSSTSPYNCLLHSFLSLLESIYR